VVARLIARSIGTDALVALLWLVAAAGVAALAFILFRTLVPRRERRD